MKILIAATAAATLLVGVAPATAGPWWRWHGPYAAQRFHPWAWGPRRFAFRRFGGFYGGGRPYGGYGGYGFRGGGYPYGGYGGGGHQTATGGPSGGLPGGS